MHMDAFFLAGEEEQPELTISGNCWSHDRTVSDEVDCVRPNEKDKPTAEGGSA